MKKLIPILIIAITTASFIGFSFLSAEKADIEELRENLLDEKSETEVTDEYIIYNKNTPHSFQVWKEPAKKEKNPDFSESFQLSDKNRETAPMENIRFTAVIKNSGNSDATGMDVYIEKDQKLSDPVNIKTAGCGKEVIIREGENIDLSNISVMAGEACLIDFEAIVREGSAGVIINDLYISPASEGGDEAGPLPSPEIRIKKREPQNTIPEADVIPHSDAGSQKTQDEVQQPVQILKQVQDDNSNVIPIESISGGETEELL